MGDRDTAAPPRTIAASDPPSATQAASRNTPGPLWAALGCYWVPLWAPPGHPWVLLGSSWATLGVHWRSSVTPGCSLAPPGRSWAVIGSPFTCWIHFGSHFSSYFLYFSEPLKTWILQYLTAFLNVLAIPKALILNAARIPPTLFSTSALGSCRGQFRHEYNPKGPLGEGPPGGGPSGPHSKGNSKGNPKREPKKDPPKKPPNGSPNQKGEDTRREPTESKWTPKKPQGHPQGPEGTPEEALSREILQKNNVFLCFTPKGAQREPKQAQEL